MLLELASTGRPHLGQSSEAGVGPSDESGVGINRKGSCWRFAEEEESSDTEGIC